MTTCRRNFEQGEPSQKKQKVASKNGLLEKVRRTKFWNPKTEQGKERFMEAILQNTSKFPSSLRLAIAGAKGLADSFDEANPPLDPWLNQGPRTAAQLFYQTMHLSAVRFLFGCPIKTTAQEDLEEGLYLDWNGPDNEIDTSDQIELVIRMFPNVLKQKIRFPKSYDEEGLLYFLASSAKSASFIPLAANLHVKFGFPSLAIGPLSCELLNNTSAMKRFGRDADAELHEETLTALLRLREMGHVKNKDVLPICHGFLSFVNRATRKSTDFVEKRLRLLIEWYPSMLKSDYLDTMGVDTMSSEFHCPIFRDMECEDYFSPLIGLLFEEKWYDAKLFAMVCEMGLLHYPDEVHDAAFEGINFDFARKVYGDENAKDAVNRLISSN